MMTGTDFSPQRYDGPLRRLHERIRAEGVWMSTLTVSSSSPGQAADVAGS